MVTMVTDRRPKVRGGSPRRETVSQVSHLTLQPIPPPPIVMLMPPSRSPRIPICAFSSPSLSLSFSLSLSCSFGFSEKERRAPS